MNPGNRRRPLLICALLCAVTVAAYWPVLDNDFISLDDYLYISNNPHIQGGLTWENLKWSFQAGYAGYWHPVTWISHLLDIQCFGLHPRGHHLVNLLFHLANTLLLFLVFQGMTHRVWRCAMVAALFAVHPLHVESVAWAAERKDVLSTFFLLLTLWAYARYVQQVTSDRWQVAGTKAVTPPPASSPATRHPSRFYWLALVFFALGLMSKPMLVTLPGVLLLLDVWPLGRMASDKWQVTRFGVAFPQLSTLSHLLLEKLPFLALSLAASWVTVVAQGRAHAVSAISALPLSDRFANAALSGLKYLEKTIWPVNLAVYYPYPKADSLLHDGRLILAGLALPAVSFFALRQLRRAPWFATGWFWYLVTLVPVIGIVQVGGQAMADRFTYIPLIGIFICLVWAGAGLSAAWHVNGKVAAVMAAAVVITGAAITHRQVKYWRDNVTLANHALAVTGNNPVAEEMLGQVLWNQGKTKLAEKHFRVALDESPDFAVARGDMATALKQSADDLVAQGKLEEAVGTYQSALQLSPSPVTLNHLGLALWQLGRREEAIQQYTEALRLHPEDVDARLNLASAFAVEGKPEASDQYLAEALRLAPDPLRTRLDFGRALAAQGKLAAAGETFREAVRLFPTNAEANLELGVSLKASGLSNDAARYFSAALQWEPDLAEKYARDAGKFEESGRFDAALRCLTIAVWLKPDDAAAHENLGLFCLRRGQPAEAQTQFEDVFRLQPDAPAHGHLGLALSMQGKDGEAIGHYEAALRLKPDWPEALNDFAWLLATTPDAPLRNGPRAVALAEQACRLTDFKQPVPLGTLAAAYAEAGRFAEAEQTAEKAVSLAEAANQPDLASRNRELLELYRAGKTVAQGRSR